MTKNATRSYVGAKVGKVFEMGKFLQGCFWGGWISWMDRGVALCWNIVVMAMIVAIGIFRSDDR